MAARASDYGHLLRMAGLFAFGVLAFAGARAALIPDDFGTLGHYRASAIEDNRADPLVHAGRGACAACHAEPAQALAGGTHDGVGCEACHGPLGRHAASPDHAEGVRPDGRTTCLRCHARLAGRPAAFPQVEASEHAPDGLCVDCHSAHSPKL